MYPFLEIIEAYRLSDLVHIEIPFPGFLIKAAYPIDETGKAP